MREERIGAGGIAAKDQVLPDGWVIEHFRMIRRMAIGPVVVWQLPRLPLTCIQPYEEICQPFKQQTGSPCEGLLASIHTLTQ